MIPDRYTLAEVPALQEACIKEGLAALAAFQAKCRDPLKDTITPWHCQMVLSSLSHEAWEIAGHFSHASYFQEILDGEREIPQWSTPKPKIETKPNDNISLEDLGL